MPEFLPVSEASLKDATHLARARETRALYLEVVLAFLKAGETDGQLLDVCRG